MLVCDAARGAQSAPPVELYVPGRRTADALEAALEAQIDAGVGSADPPTLRTMAALARAERERSVAARRGAAGEAVRTVTALASAGSRAASAFTSWLGFAGDSDAAAASGGGGGGFGTTDDVSDASEDSAARVRAAVQAAMRSAAENAARALDADEREAIEAAQLRACRAVPLALAGSLHDPRGERRVLSLAVAPGGTVAACTDSLGRALLLGLGAVSAPGYGYLLAGGEEAVVNPDAQLEQRATVGLPVLRMWKGMRDAA